MTLPWFRFYHEFSADPVVQSLAFEDQRHYVVLLCMKCAGVLDRGIAANVRNRVICRGLGLDSAAADEAKRRLLEVGLIDKSWQPTAWEKRQYKSDNSTARVSNYRKNKNSGNVTETLQKRDCNGPDTDTDTETDKPPISPFPEWLDHELWNEYEQHRKQKGSPLTVIAIKRAIQKLERLRSGGHDPNKVLESSLENGWTGLHTPGDDNAKSGTGRKLSAVERARAAEERLEQRLARESGNEAVGVSR